MFTGVLIVTNNNNCSVRGHGRILLNIECAEDGKNPQLDLCRQKRVNAFPTWEIDGKLEPGAKELSKLAEISDYQGDRTFKYRLR